MRKLRFVTVAWLLARDDDDAPTPTKLFPFFSPDLARVHAPPDMPPALAARFDRYVTGKDTLRREIQDAVYENDAMTDHPRARALQHLAGEQTPRLTDLEVQAEAIRHELALLPSTWRRPPSPMLPPALETQIGEFLDFRRRLQRDCGDFVRPIASSPPPANTQNDAAALAVWKEQRRDRTQAATDEFCEARADELGELSRQCRALYAELKPYLLSDEVPLEGDPLDVSVMEFIRRYQRDIGYYEYDLAAFEPGLSPEQRRLLLAGAIIRLELPLPAPERQAVAAPKTLLH